MNVVYSAIKKRYTRNEKKYIENELFTKIYEFKV